MTDRDHYWMQQALGLARRGADEGEVPVGALLVRGSEVLAQAWNRPIATHDPTAHAESLVLRQAGSRIGNYRLSGTTLYVTLEPCPMCAGALVWARIERLVFGAFDPRGGAVATRHHLLQSPDLNHRVQWRGGVMAAPCGELLRDFFRGRR